MRRPCATPSRRCAGNWAASHDDLVALVNLFKPLSIDVYHMHYDWVGTYLHSPRTEADASAYGRILIGQMVSTDDGAYDGALSAAMKAADRSFTCASGRH